MIKRYYSRLASVVLDWDDWMGQQHYSTQFPPSPPPLKKTKKNKKTIFGFFFPGPQILSPLASSARFKGGGAWQKYIIQPK